jgi:hypothetical protein
MKINEIRKQLILELSLSPSDQILHTSAINYFKRELGISTDVKIRYKKVSKSHSFGYFDFNKTIVIENTGTVLAISIIAHELTHVQQMQSKRLEVKENQMFWEGKSIVSYDEYNRNRDFNVHKNWPWEAEAYSNQKLLPQKYYKSAEFIKTMNSDPTLKYMLDNNLIP